MSATVRFAVTGDGVNIAWMAQGSGPTLVLSRGWITHLEHSLSARGFRDYIGVLASQFTVVRFDGRGNGMSDWDVPRPIRFADLVADLEAVLTAVGCGECTLWGSSWGGPAAIAFAAEHPGTVTRLVLDGTFADGDRLATPDRRKAFLSLFDVAQAAPDAVFAALSHLTRPESSDATADLAQRGRGTIRPDVARELYALLYDIDVTDFLPALMMPTLVLHRRKSRAVPFDCARRLAAAIPDARLVGLDGSAHNLWDADHVSSLSVLEEFLGVPLVRALASPAPTAAATVAVLFTDIVASTQEQSRLGDRDAYERVRIHDREMRAALASFGGREVKHTGDGMMAAFGSATAAVRAATMCQTALAGDRAAAPGEVPDVSIGINAGEPIADIGGDLHGLSVTVAARACSAAGPGQILVTPVVRELVAGSGIALRSAGAPQLKGLDGPVKLYEVVWEPPGG